MSAVLFYLPPRGPPVPASYFEMRVSSGHPPPLASEKTSSPAGFQGVSAADEARLSKAVSSANPQRTAPPEQVVSPGVIAVDRQQIDRHPREKAPDSATNSCCGCHDNFRQRSVRRLLHHSEKKLLSNAKSPIPCRGKQLDRKSSRPRLERIARPASKSQWSAKRKPIQSFRLDCGGRGDICHRTLYLENSVNCHTALDIGFSKIK